MKSLFLVSLLATAGPAQIAMAADLPPSPVPYTAVGAMQGPLSGWLEARFGQMVAECLPGGKPISLRRGKKEFFVSSVPKKIVDDLKLDQNPQYKVFGDASVTRIFGFIYNNTEQAGGTPHFTEADRFINIDYARDKDQLVDRDGLLFVTYDSDCKSSIKLAVEGNTGFTLSPVTVEAVAKGALDDTINQGASLAVGQFQSPLLAMWQRSTREPKRANALQFYAAVLFWDWYDRNQKLGGNWLLSYANGASLYRYSEQTRNAAVAGGVKGGFAIPFLTANASTDASFERQTRIEGRRPEYVMFDYGAVQKAYDFAPMPSVASLRSVIEKNADVRFSAAAGEVIHTGVKTTFYEDVYNLPSGFCDNRYDLTETDIPPDRLALVDVGPAPGDPSQYCRFTFGYTPGAFSGDGPLMLKFRLIARKSTEGSVVEGFALPMKTAFLKSDKPRMALQLGYSPTPAIQPIATVPAQSRLTWSIPITISDDGQTADSDVDVTNLVVDKCPSDASRVTSFTIDKTLPKRGNNSNREMTVTVSTAYEGVIAKSGWSSSARCEVSGLVGFSLNGAKVQRRLDPAVPITLPAPPASETAKVATEMTTRATDSGKTPSP